MFSDVSRFAGKSAGSGSFFGGCVVHWGMESAAKNSEHRRCVIWHRAGAKAPAALVRALSSRGLRVETSGSAHEVLAIGCAQQQRADGGRVGGVGGGGVIVVLDGGGSELDQQSRVLSALERFCPLARVWVYEEGANPPLRGFVDSSKDAAEPKAAAEVQERAERQRSERPSLRISGNNGSGSALKASDVLDKDELAALLKPSDMD